MKWNHMQKRFIFAVAILGLAPLLKGEPPSCHLIFTGTVPQGSEITEVVAHKDFKPTQASIVNFPTYQDVKVEANDSNEIAVPDFKGVISSETGGIVTTFTGIFTKAFCRDSFVKKGSPVIILPPALPTKWDGGGVPLQRKTPDGLEWTWAGGDAAPAKSYGVEVQIFDRYTHWIRARFTGSCTKKSKSGEGSHSSAQFVDMDFVFDPNQALTQTSFSSAAFRL
jgi:hypothetical protein